MSIFVAAATQLTELSSDLEHYTMKIKYIPKSQLPTRSPCGAKYYTRFGWSFQNLCQVMQNVIITERTLDCWIIWDNYVLADRVDFC